ncbi:nucleosome-remodeling factor subunit BPTF-like [Tubulanus polymorphus]|uniref:nucleosome-remodeling factor subunit BPTF-like n=1 Tax=Tubulanus polymorphus TaxID=672921 RepID=UPI003DA6C4DD
MSGKVRSKRVKGSKSGPSTPSRPNILKKKRIDEEGDEEAVVEASIDDVEEDRVGDSSPEFATPIGTPSSSRGYASKSTRESASRSRHFIQVVQKLERSNKSGYRVDEEDDDVDDEDREEREMDHSDLGYPDRNESDFDADEDNFEDNVSNKSFEDLDETASIYSVDSYSTVSSTPSRRGRPPIYPRAPALPEIDDDREKPPLILPTSSTDITIASEHVMKAIGIYEVLRHFRTILRLSPFRFEDFCMSLLSDEQCCLQAEIHICLMRCLLREEDAQNTIFGPQDTKDSINIGYFFLDSMTWIELVSSYLESDKSEEFKSALKAIETKRYPFGCIAERLVVLQILTDLFLSTNAVREDLMNEGNIKYDDHCRNCHRLGDLLCCETCPAVYHLTCVDPPLEEVPEDDWICSICKHHQVEGVFDCVSELEKSGLMSRQDPLGYDRNGRKYWFLIRRIFVEGDNEVWYYSTRRQFDELLESIDGKDWESDLFRTLCEHETDIKKQMDITEDLTNKVKGTRKSALDIENANLKKLQEERTTKRALEAKKLLEEKEKQKLKLEAEKHVKQETENTDVNTENSAEKTENITSSVTKESDDSEKSEENADSRDLNSTPSVKAEISDNSETVVPTEYPVAMETDENKPDAIKEEKIDEPINEEKTVEMKSVTDVEKKTTEATTKTTSTMGRACLVLNPVTQKMELKLVSTTSTLSTTTVSLSATVEGKTIVIKPKDKSGNDVGKMKVDEQGDHITQEEAAASGDSKMIVSSTSHETTTTSSATETSTDNRRIVTRSKTGSLTPKQFVDSIVSTTASVKMTSYSSNVVNSMAGNPDDAVLVINKDGKIVRVDTRRGKSLLNTVTSTTTTTTTQSTQSIVFKLGYEGNYKQYQNYYATDTLGLNKHQHNEERDRRRYLSHKFSLTPASDFKWNGAVYSSRDLTVVTLRQSMIQLEAAAPVMFLHPAWPAHRTTWLNAVNMCREPMDFAAALLIFEASVKPVVMNTVWSDGLGHIRMQRYTATEREEAKKRERELVPKKKKDDDEEIDRSTWAKYTLGLKHQVWKQRGEEYRIYGTAGWYWTSVTRNYRYVPQNEVGLRSAAGNLRTRKKRLLESRTTAAADESRLVAMEESRLAAIEESTPATTEESIPATTEESTTATTDESSDKHAEMEVDDTDEVKQDVSDEPIRMETDQETGETVVTEDPSTTNSSAVKQTFSDNHQPDVTIKPERMEISEEKTTDSTDKAVEPSTSEESTDKTMELSGSVEFTNKAVEPSGSVESSDKAIEPSGSVESADKVMELSGSVESTNKAVEPSGSVESTDKAIEPSGSVESMDKAIEPSSSVEPSDKAIEPSGSVEPSDKAIEPSGSVESSNKAMELSSSVVSIDKGIEPNSSVESTGKDKNVPTDELKSKVQESSATSEAITRSSDENIEKVVHDPEIEKMFLNDELIDVSKSIREHTLYPRVKKPQSKLDSLLEKRQAQEEREFKQRKGIMSLIMDQNHAKAVAQNEKVRKLAKIREAAAGAARKDSGEVHESKSDENLMNLTVASSFSCYSSSCRSDGEYECYSTSCRKSNQSDETPETATQTPADPETATQTPADPDTIQIKTEQSDEQQMDVQRDPSAEESAADDEALVKEEPMEENEKNESLDDIDVEKVPVKTEVDGASVLKDALDNAKVFAPIRAENDDAAAVVVKTEPEESPSSENDTKIKVAEDRINEAVRIIVSNAESRIAELESKMPKRRTTKEKVELKKFTPFRVGPKTKSLLKSGGGVKSIGQALPPVQRFTSKNKKRSILLVDRYDLKMLARRAGKREVPGFNYNCKMVNVNWVYPCPRPTFKICWRYRTSFMRSLSSVALQLRVLWACVRWDDLSVKPQLGGTNTISTETEITTTELLKRRDIGPYGLRSEFLVRKIIIPMNDMNNAPKPEKKYTPIRSGLRERKRPESPKPAEASITEVWVPEERVELWEIRQFAEKLEKQKQKATPVVTPITQQSQQQQQVVVTTVKSAGRSESTILPPKDAADFKEKIEQQLRRHRYILQQKRITEAALKRETESMMRRKPEVVKSETVAHNRPEIPAGKLYRTVTLPTTGMLAQSPLLRQMTKTVLTTNPNGGGNSLRKITITPKPVTSSVPVQQKVITSQSALTPGLTTVKLVGPRSTTTRTIQIPGSALNIQQPTSITLAPKSSATTATIVGSTATAIMTPTGLRTIMPSGINIQPASAAAAATGIRHVVSTATMPVSQIQQNLQIVQNTATGLMQVRGLVSGQQVIRMPDGRLLLQQPVTPTSNTTAPTTIITRPALTIRPTSSASATIPIIAPAGIGTSTANIIAAVPKSSVISGATSIPKFVTVTPNAKTNNANTVLSTATATSGASTTLVSKSAISIQQPGSNQPTLVTLDKLQQVLQFAQQQRQVKQQQQTPVQQTTTATQQPTSQNIIIAPQPVVAVAGKTTVNKPMEPIVKIGQPMVVSATTTTTSPTTTSGISSVAPTISFSTSTSPPRLSTRPVAGNAAPKTPPTPTSVPPTRHTVTPQVIQQVVQQALLQNQTPEIQTKLLAMQRQILSQKQGGSSVVASSSDTQQVCLTLPITTQQVADIVKPKPEKEIPKRIAVIDPNKPLCKIIRQKNNETLEEKTKRLLHHRLMGMLHKHKETLRKEMLKKRSFMEKVAQSEINMEVSDIHHQMLEDQQMIALKRKESEALPPMPPPAHASSTYAAAASSLDEQPPAKKRKQKIISTGKLSGRANNNKLYCVCQTPYDDKKFYIGCDLCSNWFHGSCVNISESAAKRMDSYICEDCKKQRDDTSEELYCLCRTPYDDTMLYIGCDQCQDWFHGKCVGISKAEADRIDIYICPRCKKSNKKAAEKDKLLGDADIETLRKLVKSLVAHKMGWPFLEPVDPLEVGDYYDIIKEPMDLTTLENNLLAGKYDHLHEFVKDVMKIFDNCRYYNPRESPYYQCAEVLETYFVQRLKAIKEKMCL